MFCFCRYPKLLPFESGAEKVALEQEFNEYQMLTNSDIPPSVWKDAQVTTKDKKTYHRMDVLWGYLATKQDFLNEELMFPRLGKVAKLVLTIPHSNAPEERVFTLVNMNKSDHRASLDVDGTLSSILTVKMAGIDPKWNPPRQLIVQSKKATWEYNKAHPTKSKPSEEDNGKDG